MAYPLRVLCLPVCVLLIVSCGRESQDEAFGVALGSVDTALSNGALDRAADGLERAANQAFSRASWLSVLKRSHIIDTARESHELLYRYASLAFAKFPRDEEISGLYAYAAGRSGRLEKASEVHRTTLAGNWQILADEIFIRKFIADQRPSGVEDQELLLSVIHGDNPTLLQEAANRYHDSRFVLDAALLYALSGEIETAAELADTVGKQFPETALLLNYDAMRFPEALEAANWMADELSGNYLLLESDIHHRMEAHAPAEELLLTYIESHAPNPIAFANLSLLYLWKNRTGYAMEVLNAALSRFPQDKTLLAREVELLVSAGRVEDAESKLASYRAQYVEDVDGALLGFLLSPGNASRLRLGNLLWQSYLYQPTDSQRALRLAAYLLANDGFGDLERLLEIWDKNNGITDWSAFLGGILLVADADIPNAISRFAESMELRRRWQTAYNIGVLYYSEGKFDQAIDMMRQAENLLPVVEDRYLPNKAFVRAKLGEILYKTGNITGAKRELQYALELDPHLDGPQLLLKLLESR